MNWSTYFAFVFFVSVLIVIPGPDVAVTIKNALVEGRRLGAAAVAGIGLASLLQSTAAVTFGPDHQVATGLRDHQMGGRGVSVRAGDTGAAVGSGRPLPSFPLR